MFIRCMLPVVSITVLAGCGMAGNRVSNAQEALNTATITGVVYLPEGVAASDACGAMSIQALQGGAAIGRSQVRESRGRCWYELSRLPADVDVTVHVSPPACSGGAPASLTPTEEPVRLRKDETRTRDFRATCTLGNPPPTT